MDDIVQYSSVGVDYKHVLGMFHSWQEHGCYFEAIDALHETKLARTMARRHTIVRAVLVKMCRIVKNCNNTVFMQMYLTLLEEYFVFATDEHQRRYQTVLNSLTETYLSEGKFQYEMNPVTTLDGKLLPDTWVFNTAGNATEEGVKSTDGEVWSMENTRIMMDVLCMCCYKRGKDCRVGDVIRGVILPFIRPNSVDVKRRFKLHKNVVARTFVSLPRFYVRGPIV